MLPGHGDTALDGAWRWAGRLPALARSDARYCSVQCRVSAHRARAA